MIVLNLLNISPSHLELLNQTALEIRAEYNGLISKIADQSFQNTDFWANDLMSRNTLSPANSQLFLDLSYLAFIQKILEKGEKIEKIILSSVSLAQVLRNTPQTKNIKIELHKSLKDKLIAFFFPFAYYLASCWRLWKQWRDAQNSKKDFSFPENLTLVDCFIFRQSIQNEQYTDRYYDNFGGLCKEERQKFYYSPAFIDIDDYKTLFQQIRKSKTNFLIREDFLGFGDLIYIFLHPFRLPAFPKTSLKFYGFEVNNLFKNVYFSSWGNFSSLIGVLNYRFAKKLKEKNIKIRLLIDWFENQTLDKMLNLGFETYLPEVKRIAYQPAAEHPFYLCYYPTEIEFENKLLPQEIYVTGKGFVKASKQFSQKHTVKVAPAFRHKEVWQKRKYTPDNQYFTILLALSISETDTYNILRLTHDFLDKQNISKLRVWVKQHPSHTQEFIRNLAGNYFSNEMQFVTGGFNDIVEQANLVIGATSTTVLETLAKGIPFIVIGNDRGLTHNLIPPTLSPKIWDIAYTSEQLAEAIHRFLNYSDQEKAELEQIAQEVRENYFEPVTEEGTKAFLQIP